MAELPPETESKDDMSRAVGFNVKAARLRRGLSIRELAARAGVSKAVLSRIEQGEGNPTLNTLWQLVGALQTPFSDLVRLPSDPLLVIRADDGDAMESDDGSMLVRALFDSATPRRFELLDLIMPSERRSEWRSHGADTREYSVVREGRVTVWVSTESYDLGPGDGIMFSADQEHVYETHAEPARITCVVAYGSAD